MYYSDNTKRQPRRLLSIKKTSVHVEDAEFRWGVSRWRKESVNELWTNETSLSLQHLDRCGFFSFRLWQRSLLVKLVLTTSTH